MAFLFACIIKTVLIAAVIFFLFSRRKKDMDAMAE